MRINLKVEFKDKEEVKRLGARWDGIKKTWYIVNQENLSLFKRWLDLKRLDIQKPVSKPVFTTGEYKPLCNCTTPPWEHCEHTIDAEEISLIRELRKWT